MLSARGQSILSTPGARLSEDVSLLQPIATIQKPANTKTETEGEQRETKWGDWENSSLHVVKGLSNDVVGWIGICLCRYVRSLAPAYYKTLLALET